MAVNKCSKPSGQAFRPPSSPNRQCPNVRSNNFYESSLNSFPLLAFLTFISSQVFAGILCVYLLCFLQNRGTSRSKHYSMNKTLEIPSALISHNIPSSLVTSLLLSPLYRYILHIPCTKCVSFCLAPKLEPRRFLIFLIFGLMIDIKVGFKSTEQIICLLVIFVIFWKCVCTSAAGSVLQCCSAAVAR